jgi:hypothetical protein
VTRDDIIRMAREAGFNHPSSEKDTDYYKLDRFATLVAAAEREACAKVCEDIATETYGMTQLREYGECAAAIRARGQE